MNEALCSPAAGQGTQGSSSGAVPQSAVAACCPLSPSKATEPMGEAARPRPPWPWRRWDSQVPLQVSTLLPGQDPRTQQSEHPPLQRTQGNLFCSLPKQTQRCPPIAWVAPGTHTPGKQSLSTPALHLPSQPIRPLARSSNGAPGHTPEQHGKVMAIDPGQGTEQLPEGLGAEQLQPGTAEPRAVSQQGWERHCRWPRGCQSKGGLHSLGWHAALQEGTAVCPPATGPAGLAPTAQPR